VKKEPQGGPVQPDVPETPASAAPGGAPAAPVGDGLPADPALKVQELSKQWADAVARGDTAEARRINDAIVEAKKPTAPAPVPAPQSEPPAPPATDTREQAIRRTWASAPRKVNEWTPMTVSVGEGDARRSNDMLVIQRKARGDGKGDSVLTMRVLRMGKLLASDPPEPLVFTFKLTGENKVEQVGRARVPTPEDIAQWENAGFTVPGKKAAPKAAESDQDKPKSDPKSLSDKAEPAPKSEAEPNPAPNADPELAGLQPAMAARGWIAEVGSPGNTYWSKRTKGERFTAIYHRAEGNRKTPMLEVLVLAEGGVDTGIAELGVKSAADAARMADEEVAESLKPAPAPAPYLSTRTDTPAAAPAPTNPPAPVQQTRPEELIELRKRASVLKQLLECLG
jgi:hypothetical protein